MKKHERDGFIEAKRLSGMDKKVIIIGAGGHGRVISDIVLACGDEVVGFIDDSADININGFKYLGGMSEIEKYKDGLFIVAIGNNEIRNRIVKTYPHLNYYTAIHPSAVISRTASIGAGTCVMPNATVNSMAEIGEHCIINSASVVEHDCKIADFVHLSPRAAIGGVVSIGEMSHIGVGASVVNEISICEKVIVGAGGVVNRDIMESGTYVGVPVHKLEK